MTESIDMATRHPRFTIQIPEHQYRLLKIWSWLNGRPHATFASNIVSAHIETNSSEIMRGLEVAANVMGVQTSDLMKEILETQNTDDES